MRTLRPLIVSTIGLLLVLFALPRTALAHAVAAPAELISTLLQGHVSGPFEISASQYATAEFTELEVQLGVFGATLPEDVSVEIVAISVPSLDSARSEPQQTFTTPLIRHHNAFSTTLPLNGVDWEVTITVDSAVGQGSAEVIVTPYRAPAEAPQLIRYLTFGSPLLVMLVFIAVIKGFGVALVSTDSQTIQQQLRPISN